MAVPKQQLLRFCLVLRVQARGLGEKDSRRQLALECSCLEHNKRGPHPPTVARKSKVLV